MATKATKATKRNPQDTTLRNTRAANRAIAVLKIQIAQIQARVTLLEKAWVQREQGKRSTRP